MAFVHEHQRPAKYVIQCENCGRDRETQQPNTKYCKTCRVLKDLMTLGNRTVKCKLCQNKMYRTMAHEIMCADCSGRPPWHRYAVSFRRNETCAVCSKGSDPLGTGLLNPDTPVEQRRATENHPDYRIKVEEGIALCTHCAQDSNAEVHTKVLLGLRNKMRQMRAL